VERVVDRRVPHVGALDGIRALAVTGVLLYHLRASWAPGGFAGVPVFFVLSGYLITSLLTVRYAARGNLGLRTFWRRRVRRLLPAQVALVAGVLLVAPLLDAGALRRVPAAAIAAIAQVSNWWQVLAGEPYFAAAEGPAVFAHLWSLAVEAQLYLVWPLVLAALLHRRTPVRWTLGLAAGSYLLMAVLHDPYTDPTRAWVGTDVQAGPFLLGAALALTFPADRAREAPGRYAGAVLDVAGTVALAVLAWFTLAVTDFEPFAYRGGLLAVGVATAVLLVVSVHPTSLLGRLLAAPALRWLGERSYSLYLWHWPVIAVTREWEAAWPPVSLTVFRVAVSLGLAAASYRYVENRFRRTREPAPAAPRPLPVPLLPRAAAVLSTAALLAGLGLIWDARSASDPVVLAASKVVRSLPETTTSTTLLPAAQPEPPPGSPPEPPPAPTTTTVVPVGIDIALGDSVLADAVDMLHRTVPGITVDASVGRQLVDAADALRAWRERAPFHRVVLSLGTNGPFPPDRLDELLAELQDVHRVVLVNVRMPRSWEPAVNTALAEATARWPNVVLVDWHAFARDRTELFARDGIHLTRRGAEAFALLVAAGLASDPGQAADDEDPGAAPAAGTPAAEPAVSSPATPG
jgi:peptidoglycan/LPS O-acetylase OafA/YrhL